MLAALPLSHPLAERDVVHWTDLRGEHFLLPAADPGPEIRDMLLGRLPISGGKPDIRMSRASRETVLKSEEHTSELQSLMRISYAGICLQKNTNHNKLNKHNTRYESSIRHTTNI